ncbi:MAG: class I SAM-dependent methyltransferase [Solirubrobacteraceae bacterium]
MAPRGSEAISPTAHYTGWVWARNGLSHPALRSTEGRVLYEALRPLNLVASATLGVSLEGYLLARHRAIDAALTRAIESGAVGQVIEVAAGLSARGWRFAERYGEKLTYIETDLPGMLARKQRALEQIGAIGPNHRVEVLDVLLANGPASLTEIAATLDPERGVAIITEGLLNYLDTGAVVAIWERFAKTLKRFPHGLYLSDLHLRDLQQPYVRFFRTALAGFVRGSVELHFDNAKVATGQLMACGFPVVQVLRASELDDQSGGGSELVHIIEASTSRSQ